MSDSLNIVMQAIKGMPSPAQSEALEVAHMAAAGHGSVEIARRMETTWPRIEEIRSSVGSAVVGCLRAEGYSSGEIARTLGIATPMDHGSPSTSSSAGPASGALGDL